MQTSVGSGFQYIAGDSAAWLDSETSALAGCSRPGPVDSGVVFPGLFPLPCVFYGILIFELKTKLCAGGRDSGRKPVAKV